MGALAPPIFSLFFSLAFFIADIADPFGFIPDPFP
jgi:hypothetical protein